MSLMENQSRSSPQHSRTNQHRHSAPPMATVQIHPNEQQSQSRRHSYHHQHHRQTQGRRYAKHRLSNASNSTASSFASYYSTFSSSSSITSRPFNTFEIVFTNIVDALIFTSAIAITAYNYWMGYIVDPPRIYGLSSSSPSSLSSTSTTTTSPLSSSKSSSPPSQQYHIPSHQIFSSSPSPSLLINKLDIPSPPASLSPSSPSSPLPSSALPATWESESWSDLKRTDMEVPVPQTQQNVSSHTKTDNETYEEDEEEEERVNRMEETLQELIRQGQAALTTTY